MAAAGGCFFRIKESYASLSPKEQQIADYLTQHPRQASGMSLEELAQACGSSVSSVMRLCKALKLSGYKELMKSLCGELSVLEENREFEDIHPGDDPEADEPPSDQRLRCAAHHHGNERRGGAGAGR